MAGDPYDHRLGQVELEPPLPARAVRERNVREGVVTELVPVTHDQAYKIGMASRLTPDDKERRRDMLAAQDRRDLRRPPRIGPIIEGQRDPATRRRLGGNKTRTPRTENRPAMGKRRLPTRRFMRRSARTDCMGRDPFEEDRDRRDNKAEREQTPVRRNSHPRASSRHYGFFDGETVVVVVFVCPGAVVLRPCDTPADGLVFVCPGAVVLRPCEPTTGAGAC